jgi:hypothetical protein
VAHPAPQHTVTVTRSRFPALPATGRTTGSGQRRAYRLHRTSHLQELAPVEGAGRSGWYGLNVVPDPLAGRPVLVTFRRQAGAAGTTYAGNEAGAQAGACATRSG